ncbi:secreted protein containing duf1549 : Uncharacterized protein OS=Singulisphaera acidiphila (strain ATCC BAA-1392 / DSM 18658 / VKM B-2454 / MOB10) GN=Sinac_2442 PE=4 SV=1: PSCyt1: PSCyt2: PSD1 [Gemmataceae bacterium]|nr:secreted protein containing duf1549 : Uncharacterized protein OS=Singulisphaera acidiphila (strain ATCC BAA-1392 / DSM 18658 / VKM B-2454 / MOB10) GN=Sinac_2442 PE=4 SV=1: PSCyt1: PSCyt2: PSD1 [Gemmataceae bacterium]VTT99798.1 secreted protein containing duf1549 : Uncharacterized protein OS=Singulisphaera acidiphila (strain ATCC BAA-1392 / DSM 18658 / VKM B-2454 / MOB10) GN=Sinac_2442 PE=4 SV=1: PSCyt1: PSCyt2: PSD1 [Gemmataceae bacterium]
MTRLLALAAALALAPAATAADPPKLAPADEAFFEGKVRPLLVKHCLACHSAADKKTRGGLALDTRDGWAAGGDSGPAVVPGEPDKSPLVKAVRYADESMRMPPKGKLAAEEIAALEKWVAMGAPDPRSGAGGAKKPAGVDVEAGRAFWSFRPVADPKPPVVKDAAWPRGDADRFLLAAMEARGVRPAADADRQTLLRRVTYDLTGLPPTPEEAAAFLADRSPDALAKVVDRLLASRHFGEAWGRHWLDVARYADSNGSSFNPPFREAWKYRNWVIDAVNADVPYDRFVTAQLAGDLLPAASQAERDANVVATGYLMFGSKVLGQFDKPTLLLDVVDEQLDTVGKGLLGLTLGCARCHDHKFDPVPTRDYYALAGILSSTRTLAGPLDEPRADENDWSRRGLGPGGDEKVAAFADADRFAWVKAGRKLYAARAAAARASSPFARAKAVAEVAHWQKTHAAYEAKLPPMALAPRDADEPADERIRVRGVASSPGEVVPRGFLRVAAFPGQPAVNPKQSGRLELAKWVADARNPLTARVQVNRVWAHLFGEGIVRSADNFGTRGDPPTHPELLDFLARRYVEGGWKLKPLVRELVLSRAYGLASAHDAANAARDPDNRLLWKHNRRRLSAEELRDSVLAAAGTLDRTPGTTLIEHLPLKDLGETDAAHLATLRDDRRTVYQPVIRNLLADVLEVFDFANPSMTVSRRPRTTVAPQALYLLNSPFVQDAAGRAAKRVTAAVPTRDPAAVVDAAFRLIVCRDPSAAEREVLVKYLTAQFEGPGTMTDHDVAKLCHAVLAATPFQYLD